MKKRKINTDKIKVNFFVVIFVFFLFMVFIARLCYLCVVDYSVGDNTTISMFIKNRNTEEEVLMPNRGSIYDSNGNVLAEDVASYTVIAYLDESRSENSKTPLHVVDVDATANALAPLINTDVDTLKAILSKDAYQVELGSGGRNLSQIQMEEIKKLNLPGIDFIKSTKRYYPNGNFASYTIGYTINKNINGISWKVGELGLEKYFNDTLTGKEGHVSYEKDRYGYKIANGREYMVDAKDGNDIYLTLDNNIQLFTENALKKMESDSEAEWGLMVVTDAKTGAILSYASSPSFDPNKRDMTSYIDPLTGYTYEPGSTMKIFSYMCAIENGNYNGDDTYDSGTITYEDNSGKKTVIHDWNKIGWGRISFNQGFALSSNVGAATLLENEIITKKQLSMCYDNYGFGKATGFTMDREESGSIKFHYDIEAATATFGQGITVTPIQMIQALTSISNDGEMLKPYIISKIVDTNSGKTTYQGNREVIEKVASSETVSEIKKLMASVVTENSETSTGYAYYMEDYPIIGKTGTAQIYDSKNGGYMTGASDYIYSFAGMYPSDDPSIIIYAAIKRPKDTTNYLAEAVKNVVVNTSKYLNIVNENEDNITYKVSNYLNKDLTVVSNELKKHGIDTIVLGNGSKIVGQYPSKGVTLYGKGKVIILTDNYDKKMIDLKGMSYKEAINALKLMGVSYETEGSGYVYEQSISAGNVVDDGNVVKIKLRDNYNDS